MEALIRPGKYMYMMEASIWDTPEDLAEAYSPTRPVNNPCTPLPTDYQRASERASVATSRRLASPGAYPSSSGRSHAWATVGPSVIAGPTS